MAIKMGKSTSINSVFKTFRLIESLQEPNSAYSLTEITKKLHLSIGSAQRITNSLIALGYLSKNKKTKKYRLTPKWLPIGFGVVASSEIRRIALPYLKQLYKETGESISLVIRDKDEVLYLDRLIAPDLVRFNIRAGLRMPMVSNSMGKAILAFLPSDEREEIIRRAILNNNATQEPVDEAEIRHELDIIRLRGYVVHRVQLTGGALSIAAPVVNQKGMAIAGFNIGMPPDTPMSDSIFDKNVQLLLRTANDISSEIGYLGYMEE
jgi:DNA-binding IclR family transcriptional regulator